MKTRIEPDERGNFVVEVYYKLPLNETPRWWPIRKLAFKGSAYLYIEIDVPKLKDSQLTRLIRQYDEKKVYRRERNGRFTRVFG